MPFRILFLTQIVPYPPDAGPKVKTWNVLRFLASRGHEIHLATFVRQEEEKYLLELLKVCEKVYPVPIHRSRMMDFFYWVRSNFTGHPFLIERDDLQEMRELVVGLLQTQRVDIIHADQLTMTQFVQNYAQGVMKVFDAHNAVWTILDRMAQNSPWYLKPVLNLEARRVKRYEGTIVKNFDHTLAVSDIDKKALAEALEQVDTDPGSQTRISVIPIAVDTGQLNKVSRNEASTNILTMGSLHYPPNADGIRWFLHDVFPLIFREIPNVSLTIIGKNPPVDFLEYERVHPNTVKVTGYVPSLLPYLEQAAVVVIPVRAGGGMRVRILESLAWGMPLVTTAIGLEGIQARSGEDVIVADEPREFAEATIHLLCDPALREKLSNQGRLLAEKLYDWQVVFRDLEGIYQTFDDTRQLIGAFASAPKD